MWFLKKRARLLIVSKPSNFAILILRIFCIFSVIFLSDLNPDLNNNVKCILVLSKIQTSVPVKKKKYLILKLLISREHVKRC